MIETFFEDPRAVLLRGEALDALRLLPDASVDALVTDPPAGISFMSKGWDSDKGGRDQWIAWLAEIMREVLRVLKPGAHGLVWALPRTSHWTATALENAGFEIRDVHMHIFGCVPLETEMLTAEGWKLHTDLRVGEHVAQVDASGFASFGPLQAVSVYPHSGEMVRISTRSTEQLLTAGHTVHAYAKRAKWRQVETDDEMSAMSADAFLQDQSGVCAWQLPLAARGAAARNSLGHRDIAELCGWVIAEGHFHRDVQAVSIYQNEGPNAVRIRALLKRLGVACSEYRRTRDNYDGTPRDSVQWYIGTNEPIAKFLREKLAGEKPTPTEDLAWLPDDQALALFDALVDGDGTRQSETSGAWYQKRPEVRAWFQTLCFRLGYRTSEDAGKSAISWCKSDTTEVQRGKHKERWSSRVPFVGEVWCPTVGTGRWVARYRGNVFVTGNTGFPKSLDVSKAIDASAGATRRVLGEGAAACEFIRRSEECPGHGDAGQSQSGATKHTPATAPATPEAERWSGWGTALKPAAEHWILVRKPLAGTVASNVLDHGTGALNIDACRIEGVKPQVTQGICSNPSAYAPAQRRQLSGDPNEGRWPAHVSLAHSAACDAIGDSAELSCALDCPVRMLDEQSGVSCSSDRPRNNGAFKSVAKGAETARVSRGHDDSGGASRFFYVAKGSRSEKDRGCEALPPRTGGEATDREEGSAGLSNPRAGAGRTGGARNHHPTVKSIALMRWLVRLVTPPGGLVLDCFTGSGSTGVAALHEGFQFLGVERDLDDKTGESLGYCEIIKARLLRALADTAKEG